ncbi:hypothetical protein [Hyphomonas johnsonii]|jgi:hypothetical protein|uniref:DUF2178 domain-containing protein n=1 Tax=Hyphomonas johnsonii MHS-2 TaxID=1280950 RepID=A0A059FPT5_9PROT|nr:hypothetical protein [Hyphomonas johnsonii]KCZ92695.1 hypothetical protein HJO_07067 [Hyphomonas johnsonii MHS-2]
MTSIFRIDIVASILAILVGLLNLGAYWGLFWTPPESGAELHLRVGISVAVIVVLTIIISIIIAILNRNAPDSDEREEMIGLRASRNAMYIFAGGVTYIFLDAFEGHTPMDFAHLAIGVFILAESVRLASLFHYTRTSV